ncbi:hypothetical protein JCM19046_4912 [Bacillus sp. JCM 19046]|uniref:DUF1510 domain-containing protein n=1 Tax=Shouchella xiaoxiensis TaxID=766895 RepID=A0ABS2SRA6_9BACI|nr:YrrS family protein [Shouchella xiaoxiensis]MBM7838034.1 hypothetical protein [Shouchella xiaoxiensis]GAF12336.1 hypothetical protein JCM19045_1513 [Bacillus sp. JCM 19045]GAF20205.1 hypothetical protein JCM19046_4912 [Bacillus sp. JCM 19046]
MSQRYQKRKSNRTSNRILNIAITVVAALILFLGGSLLINFFGGSEDANVPEPETGIGETGGEGETIDEDEEAAPDSDEGTEDESGNTEDDEATEEDEDVEGTEEEEGTNEDEETEEEQSDGATLAEGDILQTEQANPTPNDFSSSGENWNEMVQALYQATGLNSSTSELMWLGNGGSTTSSVGTLLEYSTGLYYQVRLEWEDNQGWRIGQVTEHQSNPRN